jgi:hypothetical protein
MKHLKKFNEATGLRNDQPINTGDYSDLLSSCKKIIKHLPLNGSSILEGVDLLPSTNESKNASELPTAEEFLTSQGLDMYDKNFHAFKKMMIEFAKLHVEATLKAVGENAEIDYTDYDKPFIEKESILNAYPLENIK